MSDVWVVCRLLIGDRAGQFEVNGVYSTLEGALAACVDDRTHAARFTLDADCREVYDFEIVTRANPIPTMSRTGDPAQ